MRTGWHSRGYLPHIEAGQEPQFLTWRLADSVPKSVLDVWFEELARRPERERKRELMRRVGKFLDAGFGSCVLRMPHVARIVQEGLMYYHPDRYVLHSWVVMPNHVHTLLTPQHGHEVARIMQSLKSYTAKRINEVTGSSGTFWQRDYLDKLILDREQFERIRLYIEWNPVKAGLCFEPQAWPFSSACEAAREKLAARTRAGG